MKSLTLIFALLLAPLLSLFAGETAIRAGDTVAVRLLVPAQDAANVTSEYVVSDAGTVRVPYLEQEIKAAGLTPSALARQIERSWVAAEIYTQPRLQITGKQDATTLQQSVYVSGEIKTGGAEVPFKDGLRLLQAITKSGGFTEFADVKKVKILREGRTLGPYNMSNIAAGGENNPVLQPDDQIIVPQD